MLIEIGSHLAFFAHFANPKVCTIAPFNDNVERGVLKSERGSQAMISEDARERMRRAYYLEKKTLRQIAREEGFSRVTIQKAISDASPEHTL